MRFLAVLNRDGGTLRTTDLDKFEARLTEKLNSEGHSVKTMRVAGRQIVATLKKAANDDSCDVVIAGGGDGTIFDAASQLMETDKILAVLPAGTMNLFARSLKIPLALDAAVDAFATGVVRDVDVASANGRPFVHQFSIGMHAKMVHLRSKMEFGSRLGKIRASARAAWGTVMKPPSLDAAMLMDETEILVRTPGIGITNNLFGEGHLPYADDPAGGVLGIYVTSAEQPRELLLFFANMAIGRWRDNTKVEIHQSDRIVLKIRGRIPKSSRKCVIDGELADLDHETELKIHPKSLKVLIPEGSS